ncbi:MAG: hypothetical protein ACRD1H_13175, partial [Vicinamibacterales bacterium]
MTTTFDDHDLSVALTDASLDAPRVDLWERIEQQTIGISRRRHPVRRGLRSLAAVLALLLAGGVMLTVFSLADDGSDRAALPINAVPDMLLMSTFDEQTRRNDLRAFLPESNGVLTVLEDVTIHDMPVISRDGKQIVYSGWQQDGETMTLRLWSFDSATMAVQWTADVASGPVEPDGGGSATPFSTAIAGQRVYIAWHGWDEPFPIPIRAY